MNQTSAFLQDFHNDIMCIVVFILCAVLRVIGEYIYGFCRFGLPGQPKHGFGGARGGAYAAVAPLTSHYGRRNHTNTNHNVGLEVAWTIIPSLTLLLIALPSFILLYSIGNLTGAVESSLKVIGRQWYWHYEYSSKFIDPISQEIGTTLNPASCVLQYRVQLTELDSYMKVDSLIDPFRLLGVEQGLRIPRSGLTQALTTSDDVIHGWSLPSLGIKVDAVPGRLNRVLLSIEQRGYYYGQCSEICGRGHGFMPIGIVVF
jgi:cytochrome c oxidase subunit 2